MIGQTQLRKPSRRIARQPNWGFKLLEPRLMLAGDAGAEVGAAVGGEAVAVAAVQSQTTTSSIVFVDGSLDDLDSLIESVDDAAAEIVLLSPDSDGVEQISQLLASRSGVRTVHIVSHGSEGSLTLGGAQLDAETMQTRRQEIQQWQNALASGADILLYGCDVASGPSGKAFVGMLAGLTGADVASSDDVTGSTDRGADWDLEYHIGDIQADLAFRFDARQAYQGLLANDIRSRKIEIFAAGETGQENLDLFIDQQYVTTFFGIGGNAQSRDFQRFEFQTDAPVSADQVSVAFGNDAFDPATGLDRNLIVDKIKLGGVTFETEDPSTRSTGIWQNGLTGPGNYETEILNINSIFTYSVDGGQQASGQITVDARGETGDEILQVRVDDQVIQEFTVGTELATYTVGVDQSVTADRVQIAFVNDLYLPDEGVDRNLIVQQYSVNETQVDPASESVLSTGTFLASDGIVDGFGRGNTLNGNGFFQVSDSLPNGSGTEIRFDAKGTTLNQVIRLTTRGGELIEELTVQQGRITRGGPVFEQYIVNTDRDLTLEDLRIEFVNDGIDETGRDRNVTIGAVLVEDLDNGRIQRTSAVDNQTFSTGSFLEADGLQPGFGRGDTLTNNGYFEFAESSRIQFNLFGQSVGDQYDVFIRDQYRATFTSDDSTTQVLDVDEVVRDEDVRIVFSNPGTDTIPGLEPGLRVASIVIDGQTHLGRAETVQTSAEFDNFGSLILSEGDFVQFGVDVPGDVGFNLRFPSASARVSDGEFRVEARRIWDQDNLVELRWVAENITGDLRLAESSGTVTLREDQRFADVVVLFASDTGTGEFDIRLEAITPGVDTLLSPVNVRVV